MSAQDVNFTREAFFHPGNVAFLFCAMLAALLLNGAGSMSSVVLSAAFGLELVYLGTVPKSVRFQRNVKLGKLRERHHHFGEREIYDRLDEPARRRFLVLKHIADLIRENFEKMPYTGQGMLDNIYTKMKGLLTNYISSLEMLQRFRKYLNEISANDLEQEIKDLEMDLKNPAPEKLIEIKSRRLNILRKRLEKVDSAREKYLICESQLETIEDAIRYIYEKSITMTNPEEIGFQLDNLINDLEETAAMMGDLEDELPPGFTLVNRLDDELDEAHKSAGFSRKATGKSPEAGKTSAS